MQFLRRVTGSVQRNYVGSTRTFGVESTSHGAARKSKGERFELVMQFISKYQALHNGQLPGITILRKEVGGKYDTLKEILDSLKSTQHIGVEQPSAQKTSRKKLKKHADTKEADNIRDDPATQAMEQRAQKRGPFLDASGSGKDTRVSTIGVCNSDVTASDGHLVPLSQKKTPSKVATRNTDEGDMPNEFPLLLHGISQVTTPKDLREAFEDCGEIWNASVIMRDTHLRYYPPTKLDAIINFKTEGGRKSAIMKESVFIRGQLFPLKQDLKLTRTRYQLDSVSSEAHQGTQIKYKDLRKSNRAR